MERNKIRTYVYFTYKDISTSTDNQITRASVEAYLDLTKIAHYEEIVKFTGVKNFIEQISDEDGKVRITAEGYAKCNPDDLYDKKFGEDLALSKAQHNAFRLATAIYGEIVDIVNTYIKNLYDCYGRTIDSYNASLYHIDDVLGSIYEE